MRLRSPPENYRFLDLPQKWNQNLVEKVAERGGLRPVARRAAAAEAGCANPALALSLWTPVGRTCGLDADVCPSATVTRWRLQIILLKTGHLTLNRVLNFRDNCRAISSALHHVLPQSTKASAATYRIGLPMIKHFIDGLLFFDRGRELRIVAYHVSRTNAQLHADRLGLLPIHFYITLDNFLTVGKCRLLWRHRDDIGVVFERWIDIGQRIAVDQAGAGDCGDHRHR